MNSYIIKVTEIHTDSVIVEASSKEEAERKALEVAECQFAGVSDLEVISEQSIEDQ